MKAEQALPEASARAMVCVAHCWHALQHSSNASEPQFQTLHALRAAFPAILILCQGHAARPGTACWRSRPGHAWSASWLAYCWHAVAAFPRLAAQTAHSPAGPVTLAP